MLVNAMQVCGAVYLRSDEAVTFVRRTLVYLKDNLVAEFVSQPTRYLLRALRRSSNYFAFSIVQARINTTR
jgi:hypothetical protein